MTVSGHLNGQDLTRAVVLWTGRGRTSWPARDDQIIITRYGDPGGRLVLAQLRDLESDFYLSKAHESVPGLSSMGDQAAAEFRQLHPEVEEEAVLAFRWCYTFDWK